MRLLVGAMIGCLAFGCGGGDGTDDDFTTVARDFAAVICAVEAECFSEDEQACRSDVAADMEDARGLLDDDGEARCIACMQAKRREAQKVLDASCDVSAADVEAVLAVCDLDPASDYDDDGVLDNDHDEACAGYP
jgi:hypothetical protein